MDEEAVCRTEMACRAIRDWCRTHPAQASEMQTQILYAIEALREGLDALNEYARRAA